ncbi:putative DEAD-box ATP-dependent RNA helicase 51 [Dichanthelium oligosanthes]|uniref:ATP-dependent RNA helicase n=1 Tax=Dichanthelium oligosanthes TaxID=888268 RepID=A0A1E5UX02_9POAL|nr:putative DEAD-box ATP-dependent RNA helicase 51 [Dichanthelium oligosanthes]
MELKPCSSSAQASKNPVAALPESDSKSVDDTACCEEEEIVHEELKGKRKEGNGMEKKGKKEEESEEKKEEEKPKKGKGGGILTNKLFSEHDISELTAKAIREMNYTHLTEIQARSIPHLMVQSDVMGSAKTGSGKTLAFLIPAIELLRKSHFMPRKRNWSHCDLPNKGACYPDTQCCQGINEVSLTNSWICVIGGTNMRSEANQLANGINVLVATPGRLLDHLRSTSSFNYKRLKCLIIDEADRILEQNFEEDMKQIFKRLPRDRQTVLFSATQTQKVEDFANFTFGKKDERERKLVYVGVDDSELKPTVEGLQQGYCVIPSEKRFLVLYAFLRVKARQEQKVMVFFSSCSSVKFHAELLNTLGIECYDIHEQLKQQKRTSTFFRFLKEKRAARGLDIPEVDYIVQYDPPDDPKDYIHRVGRTARGDKGKGRALLFLLPEELKLLIHLQGSIMTRVLEQENIVGGNYFLKQSAKEAYRSYLLAYNSLSMKGIFDIHQLDLKVNVCDVLSQGSVIGFFVFILSAFSFIIAS